MKNMRFFDVWEIKSSKLNYVFHVYEDNIRFKLGEYFMFIDR